MEIRSVKFALHENLNFGRKTGSTVFLQTENDIAKAD